MRPSTYTCAAVSTASTALHVYTCSTDLNWANSYMVSNVMDSFTPLTTCVKLQTRSLFWSRLWETSRTLATFTSHDSWYLMNDVTTSDIRKFCEFSFTIFRSAWSFCVNINSQKEKFSRFSRMVIARSLTEQTVFVNTEQRSVGSWLADRIFNMLPGRPPPWIVGFLWAHFNPLPPWMGYCLQGTRAERGPYERWRTGRLTLILAFLPFARVRPHSIFDASPKVVVIIYVRKRWIEKRAHTQAAVWK